MPNPLDALRKASSISDPTYGMKPTLSQMPLAPWGSIGAEEGAVSPSALGALKGLYRRFMGQSGQIGSEAAAGAAGPSLANITPDLVQPGPPVPQVMPSSSDVDALEGLMRFNLAKAGPRIAQRANPLSTLGSVNPEYTAVGEEGLMNAIRRRGVQPSADPADAAYNRIMSRSGK